MFRTGLAHSSGVVYVGTYGPQPAIVWKYDPRLRELKKVGAPGEYQLDSMVEAPNGKVYIGTAYGGIVYELDPQNDSIRSLGSPPVDSTTWIFTMIRTRDGEIYGAKGVGIFRLDWRTGRMESCGIVPGNHTTPGDGGSQPIVRTLEERPDGVIWGDTNRWIFTFDPKTRKITPVVDVAAQDDACYALLHANGESPLPDLYFQIYSRFSGKQPKHPFMVCRASTGKIEPLGIKGLEGNCFPAGWWRDGDQIRWLIAHRAADTGVTTIAVIDLEKRAIIERWTVSGGDMPPGQIAGPGLWFISGGRGTLYQAQPSLKRLVAWATNPEPAQSRCLAMSSTGQLGAYAYDCGFAFTYDIREGRITEHGRVDFDDHRMLIGPAAFAGSDYLVANGGESVPRLWVSDLRANKHWVIGQWASQLVSFQDGTVWGTYSSVVYGWRPASQALPGTLFRYRPGQPKADVMPNIAGSVGAVTEAPNRPGDALVTMNNKVVLYDAKAQKIAAERQMPAPAVAIAADPSRGMAYVVLSGGAVMGCTVASQNGIELTPLTTGFGGVERGCFVLPRSKRLVGIADDGTVSVFDPNTRTVSKVKGPIPQPAGPAVHPTEDAWYFADRSAVRYSLLE
jgi:DNA-binding beta-propeller fold protein YncE